MSNKSTVISTMVSRASTGVKELTDIKKLADEYLRLSYHGLRAKVFQPFFTTKPTGQGTGLGLSLAYDIVTKGHSWTLEVESTEGVGSEFIIQLPI